ncbi:hypothetical protein CALVIDRAFT_45896 [Calocera viscosa TUFC12733]|uniref:Uncharacterized protein n=1 Tax=Calocera viscosa (strain TUFC12733) TaxID=1330018 RepID=A0A167P5A8_CALVF|nr:hypothetical protein CALVIDRAFT_45896 [Calocera viscosa TUFC12733]
MQNNNARQSSPLTTITALPILGSLLRPSPVVPYTRILFVASLFLPIGHQDGLHDNPAYRAQRPRRPSGVSKAAEANKTKYVRSAVRVIIIFGPFASKSALYALSPQLAQLSTHSIPSWPMYAFGICTFPIGVRAHADSYVSHAARSNDVDGRRITRILTLMGHWPQLPLGRGTTCPRFALSSFAAAEYPRFAPSFTRSHHPQAR